jgi:predicted MFS family arabinose efflux permease
MTTLYFTPVLASTYGSGAYDTANYDGIVTLAAVIILVAMIVRIWRRPNKKQADTDEL